MDFAEKIDHPVLKALYHYWIDKKDGTLMPARRDIDPVEMKAWLPHIYLVDVIDGGKDFRYRLAGTAVERIVGRSITGKRLAEVFDRPLEDLLLGLFRRASHQRHIIHCAHAIESKDRSWARFERLILPLANDHEHVDMLLGGLCEERPNASGLTLMEVRDERAVKEVHVQHQVGMRSGPASAADSGSSRQ